MDFTVLRLAGGMAGSQKFFDLRKGEKYLIPRYPERPTHLRLYNGKGSWGISAELGDKKTKRGIFFKIPDDQVNYVKLSDYVKNYSGHNYGEPSWHV